MIDGAMAITLLGTAFLDGVVVWFHLAFLVNTIAAYRLDRAAFAWRGLLSLAIVTTALVRDWQAEVVPFDEVLELPILAAVPVLINVVAVRRARLEREVAQTGLTVQQLRQARVADRQDRDLFDLSLESTRWLAASATHDLNNILATILVSSEAIADRHPERHDPEASQIEHAVDAARQLVGGVSELIGSGTLDSWCDLHEVVTEVVELHTPARERAIDVCLDLVARDPRVHLPRVLAYQLVSNLVINALAAMPDGGVLLLRTAERSSPPMVELTVQDDGHGMSPAVRDRAFDPDFTTRPLGGSGLGLYTVGRIVDAADGSVDLVTSPGYGTAITVGLPGGAAPPARTARIPTYRPIRLMLVEDEPLLRTRWASSIESHGYDVSAVADAQEALHLIHADGAVPDVLVTDFAMPGVDGLELVESLRREAADLPVVLVSGLAPTLPDGWSEHPRNTFLAKPCSVAQLLDAVDQVLGEPIGARGDLPVRS